MVAINRKPGNNKNRINELEEQNEVLENGDLLRIGKKVGIKSYLIQNLKVTLCILFQLAPDF